MASSDPRSWLDKAVGVCLAFLVGAAAVFIAVKLIEAVMTTLIVILAAAGIIAISVAILRARSLVRVRRMRWALLGSNQ